MAPMQHIDADLISHSLPDRITYLQSFLSFSPDSDGPLIHACKPVLAPLLPTIIDAVYDQLLQFDITASAFSFSQSSSQSDVRTEDLHRDHEHITHRKDFLKGYLLRLASNTDWRPSSKFWSYIDMVGKAHTGTLSPTLPSRTGKPALWVEYRDVNLLLGWVENAVIDIVMGVESLDIETRVKIVKALNKYWWIQNDLFARHYIVDGERPGRMGEESNGEATMNGHI